MRYWNYITRNWRVRYPFPLADGRLADLDLPDEPLAAEDAERLADFVAVIAQPEPFDGLCEQWPACPCLDGDSDCPPPAQAKPALPSDGSESGRAGGGVAG